MGLLKLCQLIKAIDKAKIKQIINTIKGDQGKTDCIGIDLFDLMTLLTME